MLLFWTKNQSTSARFNESCSFSGIGAHFFDQTVHVAVIRDETASLCTVQGLWVTVSTDNSL